MERVKAVAIKPWIFFKRLSKKKKALLIILIIIIIISIITVINANKPVQYNKAKVQRGSITEIVAEPGVISSTGTVDISSPATGIIEALYVENGQMVTEGQELFRIKSTASDAEKAAANATYQKAIAAQKAAEQSKSTLDAQMWAARQAYISAQNTEKLMLDNQKNPTTTKDYTELEKESVKTGRIQTEKSFKALEKQVVEADVAIAAAQADTASAYLSYQTTLNAVVKAPANGMVANLSVSQGDAVTASAATSALSGLQTGAAAATVSQSSSPVLSLTNDVSITVKMSIGQSDIAKIRAGQEAVIEPDAYPDKLYHGRVSRVDSIGQDVQGVVSYNVYVSISDADTSLRTGMTADTDIITEERDNVLLVPNAAVKPYKGKRAVRVYDAAKKELKYISVETGIRGTKNTEIKKGLTEGQEIVTTLTNDQIENSGPF